MHAEHVIQVLSKIPNYCLTYNIQGEDKGIMVSCPLAPRRHRTGRDGNPSMWISLDGIEPMAFCHACGYSRSFETLLLDLYSMGIYPDMPVLAAEVRRIVTSGEVPLRSLKKVDKYAKYPTDLYTDLIKDLLKQPLSPGGIDFLASKNVDPEVARTKFLCSTMPKDYEHPGLVDRDGEMTPANQEMLMLPTLVRDPNLRCVGSQARPITQLGKTKYFSPLRFPASKYFFGQHLLTSYKDGIVILVEGAFDCMHLVQLGLPALGTQGVNLFDEKMDVLEANGIRTTIVMMDPDEAGQTGAAKMKESLTKRNFNVHNITFQQDPKYLTREQIQENSILSLYNNVWN